MRSRPFHKRMPAPYSFGGHLLFDPAICLEVRMTSISSLKSKRMPSDNAASTAGNIPYGRDATGGSPSPAPWSPRSDGFSSKEVRSLNEGLVQICGPRRCCFSPKPNPVKQRWFQSEPPLSHLDCEVCYDASVQKARCQVLHEICGQGRKEVGAARNGSRKC